MTTLIPHRLLSLAASLSAVTLASFTLAVSFTAVSCSVPEPNDATEPRSAAVDSETGAPANGEVGAGASANGPQNPQDPRTEQERNRVLVEKMIERADQLLRNGKAEAAQLEILKAQSRDPNNERVMGLLRAINAELGIRPPAGSFGENEAQLYRIQQERARAEVTALISEARGAADAENYDEALRVLHRASLNIEIGENIDWGQLDEQVSALTDEISAARDRADSERSAAMIAELDDRNRQLQRERMVRDQARRDTLLAQATRAFERRSFKLAQDLAAEAMAVDSNSMLAREVHDAAIKARRESETDRYYRDMSQALRDKIEADADLRIPTTSDITMNNEIWERANVRSGRTAARGGASADDMAMRQRVASETISGLSFTEDDGSYSEVKTRIQTITNIPIIISSEASSVIEDEALTVQLDIVAPMSVANLLNHMTQKSETLAWTVNNGVVVITTKALAGGQNTQQFHDVRDLVYPRTVFFPPQIREIPTGDSDSTQPRTGGESDEQTFFIEMDPLVQTLRDATDPLYWDAEGGGTIDQTEQGYLIVVANPKMQAAVSGALDDLRAFATTVVKVDSKFLTITRNFLQQIGVDIRGLGGSGSKGTVATLDDVTTGLDDNASRGSDNAGTGDPAAGPASGAFFNDGGDGDLRGRTENFFSNPLGSALSPNGGATAALVYLDDLELQMLIRAVQKQEDVEELNGQTVTIQNNERGYVAVVNQTSYIRDFDVEVAQAAFIADPKVDVIQDGIVLDVKPTIHHDRKNITLDLNPTVAELVRPIPTFSTSLAGTTQPVTLQLPQLTVRSFATTATVPDGGSLLIGGLREVLTVERRAEVPILGKIPLLSFFFKEEGVIDENSSLMVLVTATITDVKEYAEKF